MKKLRNFIAVLFAAITLMTLTLTASASAYSVSLDDLDNCLTEMEEDALRVKLRETAEKIGCNVGVCITADLKGRTDVDFSNYYVDKTFGNKTDSVALILLNRYGKYSEYIDQIRAEGKAADMYSISCIENHLFPRIYNGLDDTSATSVGTPIENVYDGYSSAQFYQAIVQYCNVLVDYSNPTTAFWATIGDFFASNGLMVFVAGVIAVIFCFVVSGSVKKGYSKKKPISAANYVDRRKTRVIRQADLFVREYTTSYRVSSSSGGRGGGGGGGGGGGHSGGGRGR